MSTKKDFQKALTLIALGVAGLASTVPAAAGSTPSAVAYPVYSGIPWGAGDGCCSGVSALAVGSDGNYYGANTVATNDGSPYPNSLFKVTTGGIYTQVHSFAPPNPADGSNPDGLGVNALVAAPDGTVFGSAAGGGASSAGTLFKLTTDGQFSVLYTFTGAADGGQPNCIIRDANGNLYGSTARGGSQGIGTLFKLGADGRYRVLYNFAGPASPNNFPMGSNGCPALGPDGHLYGVGAPLNIEYGMTETIGSNVYELTGSGKLKILHRFLMEETIQRSSGNFPMGGLTLAADGNFYGVLQNLKPTLRGFTVALQVYRITPGGAYSVVAQMDGMGLWDRMQLLATPDGSLFAKVSGADLYRVNTSQGGFEKLYSFAHGAWPGFDTVDSFADGFGSSAWAADANGNLITAALGSNSSSVIDRIVPSGDMSVSATATPASVAQNGPITLDWTTSGASACTFAGLVPDNSLLGASQPLSGSLTTSATNVAGAYDFALQCTDAAGGIARSLLSVTVK